MKRIKSLLLLVAVLLCLFLGLWFAQDNPDQVTVTLLGFPLPELSLGIWLVVTLFTGILLGLLSSLPLILRAKSENRRLKRQL